TRKTNFFFREVNLCYKAAMLQLALFYSFATINLFLPASPAEEMSASTAIELEQTFTSFISDYETIFKKEKVDPIKKFPVLQAMRSQLVNYRLSILSPKSSKKMRELGPCVSHVVKETSNKSLASPAQVALRLNYLGSEKEKEMKAAVNVYQRQSQKNEKNFFACMESQFIKAAKTTSAQLELRDLLKTDFSRLMAN
ncbi:MAG: hypothetical protein JWQ35_379, partial [Bacteriovoracaceae bacterium]|nr:hypothetical protein [Bacteriovoracaceae bacterium]